MRSAMVAAAASGEGKPSFQPILADQTPGGRLQLFTYLDHSHPWLYPVTHVLTRLKYTC